MCHREDRSPDGLKRRWEIFFIYLIKARPVKVADKTVKKYEQFKTYLEIERIV